MIRFLATIILPLLLPTLLYVLWLVAAQRVPLAGSAAWRALPWPWLLGVGIVLAALTLYVIGARIGGSPVGHYVPPQWIGGKIVPGHIEPPAQR
jgi:Family of unknown function (DUF6111)